MDANFDRVAVVSVFIGVKAEQKLFPNTITVVVGERTDRVN
jgi:hypothetical protein